MVELKCLQRRWTPSPQTKERAEGVKMPYSRTLNRDVVCSEIHLGKQIERRKNQLCIPITPLRQWRWLLMAWRFVPQADALPGSGNSSASHVVKGR